MASLSLPVDSGASTVLGMGLPGHEDTKTARADKALYDKKAGQVRDKLGGYGLPNISHSPTM